MICSLLSSISMALIPRLSYYLEDGDVASVKKIVDNSYNYSFMMSVPCCFGIIILSKDVMYLAGGSEYSSEYVTLIILSFIILFSPISAATNQQTFVPMRLEHLILVTTCIGAVVDFFLNIILIPIYGANGAGIATLIAEIIVMLISMYNASKYIGIKGGWKNYYQYFISALPILAIGFLVNKYIDFMILRIFISIILSAVLYFLILTCFFKNKFVLLMIDRIRLKISSLRNK